jgi:hypothetical protein
MERLPEQMGRAELQVQRGHTWYGIETCPRGSREGVQMRRYTSDGTESSQGAAHRWVRGQVEGRFKTPSQQIPTPRLAWYYIPWLPHHSKLLQLAWQRWPGPPHTHSQVPPKAKTVKVTTPNLGVLLSLGAWN